MAHYDNYSKRGKPTKFMTQVINASHNRVYKKIRSIVNNRSEINFLEIGGGKGEFASVVTQDDKCNYFSVEPNKKLAERLRKYGEVKVSTVPPIPFDQSFDVIYSSNVIEHVPAQKVSDFVESCRDSLIEKGVFVIRFPNFLDFKEMFWDCDYTHVFPTTENRIRQLLIDHELEVEEVEIVRLENPGPIRFLFFILSKLLRIYLKVFRIRSNSKLYKLYLSSSEQIIIYARKVISKEK